MEDTHIIPVNDLRQHNQSVMCECQPVIELQPNGARVVLHNSYDNREFTEIERYINSNNEIDEQEFTHYGSFYGVPVYLNDQTDEIAGCNILFDYLFLLMVWFHNTVIERFAQLFAAIFGQDYEPGFPLKVRRIEK